MMLIFEVISFFIIAILLSPNFAQTPFEQDPKCGMSSVSSSGVRIVGGNETKPGEFPWIVSMQYDNKHMCGATVIDKKFILTAAHCFQDTGIGHPNRWRIVAGEHQLSVVEGPERVVQVRKILLHEGYSATTNEHDIALLKLSSPLSYSDRVMPICVADSSLSLPARTPVTVIGWGTVQFDSGTLSDTLRRVNVYTYDTTRCGKIYQAFVSGAAVVPTGMMCAGDISGGKDSCQGDSGGPLMQLSPDGRWTQVGVVSWGAACGRPLLAGVYTKVATYRDWIEDTIEKNGASSLLHQQYPSLAILPIIISTYLAAFQRC